MRTGRLSGHRPDGERRRVLNDWMLWIGTALMRFVPFPTINSELSNAAVPRLQSRHVVGVTMEKRLPMTENDVAPEHPNLNEGCESPQGRMLSTQPSEGPQSRSQ
jgi:hypothetical protein